MTDGAARPDRRQRSLHCGRDEQAMIRAAAAESGKTISRFVLDLALADDVDRHPVALTEAEQAELRDGMREVRGFVRAVRDALPEDGPGLAEAIAALAREREA